MEFFSDCFTKSKLVHIGSSEPSEEQNKFHRFKCIYLRTIEWYNRAVLQHSLLGGELLHDVLHIDNYAKCIQHSSEGLVRGSKRKLNHIKKHFPKPFLGSEFETFWQLSEDFKESRSIPLASRSACVVGSLAANIRLIHCCAFLRSQYLQQQKWSNLAIFVRSLAASQTPHSNLTTDKTW